MKKILFLLISITMLSCGVSKNIKTKEKVIKGNWTLNKITYSKTGSYNVTLFKDQKAGCFVGSSWKFVPNNNSGTYVFKEANCSADEREFIFVIQEVDEISGYYDFLLKPKKNESNIGFRVKLKNLSEDRMLWQQTIRVDGEPFIINMNFIKQ
ncbi:lipocalin family protein [Polaribacter porphyrae]|uniref:Lipocalin n=1 Tax=Polaribacter porphyrae TaxID=1137780 RepID=A0A2S7WRH3_9FLAO|nr:lipocalin family protein [Polaribacter porphyrae]PQJ79902.1 lipocalin [Polaribacter porphyrae]